MAGAIYILNDDVETADAELSKGTSPFHKVSISTLAAHSYFQRLTVVMK